jgi:RNA polymerase sigma-70 factor (ECF subfamily)
MPQAARALVDTADESLPKARAGDPAAFAEIVRRHQGLVFSFAFHVLGDRGTAEELAQEVFLELYRSLPRITSADHLTFWLRRVTSHRCIDFMRRRRHIEVPLEQLREPGAWPVATDVLFESRVRSLVAGLPPRARMVVVLRYQEDLDPSEIADALAIPVNTVKSHLRRSIALLRARLGLNGERT